MKTSDLRFHPPAGFTEIAEALEAEGCQAWAVGGAVRDELLGIVRADWDVATDARPHEVRSLFRRTVPLGMEHGTVGVISSDGTMYEVTTFRRDVETDGRHAVVEFADSVDEDLGRRDFTINAIAWRPSTGELRDPFGGRGDLEARVLRAVGDARLRFAEDHLRVLRGLRFVGRFGLEFDPQTCEALEMAVPRLVGLSAERVREELLKVLGGTGAAAVLRLYAETGALEVWYPELMAASRNGDAWETALEAVERVPPHRTLLRVSCLLLAVPGAHGADRGGRDSEAVEGLLRRLKFSNAEIRRITRLYEHYLPLVSPADSSAQLREWLAEVGVDAARDLFRLHFAAARARGSEEAVRGLLFAWGRVHEEICAAPPLRLSDLALDGNDVVELGVPRGPLVGLVLEELHAQVLEDPECNRRDELLDRARELIEMGGLDRLRDA